MILVIAEHGSERATQSSREVIAAAQPLGAPITVVLPCAPGGADAAVLSSAAVHEVVQLESPALAAYSSAAYVAALAPFVRDLAPSLVLLPHSYQSRDFAPRLAARLALPFSADCTALAGPWPDVVVTRPLFQGKLLADVALGGPGPHIITMQAGAYRADRLMAGATAAPVRLVSAHVDTAESAIAPPYRRSQQGVDLARADRIVAAGRGFKDQAQLGLARELAAALGAELAASRPICDVGWLPMDRQVGSSGQTVAPRLYVALGVSGAIQHVIGMKASKTIVAVNKDADAPIFEVADYGIVGDLLEVVPALIAALGASQTESPAGRG